MTYLENIINNFENFNSMQLISVILCVSLFKAITFLTIYQQISFNSLSWNAASIKSSRECDRFIITDCVALDELINSIIIATNQFS